LFSILGDVAGSKVLDLYAGSGALGIEALSRGAAAAVFVEAARPALTCLRENLTKLGLEDVGTALPVRVENAAAQLQRRGPFDLVLCDPPWRDVATARRELEALAAAGLFTPDARIVLEHAAKEPPPSAGDGSLLRAYDVRAWGDTGVTIFGPADVPGAASDPEAGPA
jgi:16S rRNA (guanine966-N2)-methyltransferase